MTHPSPALPPRYAQGPCLPLPASRGEGNSMELTMHINREPFASRSGCEEIVVPQPRSGVIQVAQGVSLGKNAPIERAAERRHFTSTLKMSPLRGFTDEPIQVPKAHALGYPISPLRGFRECDFFKPRSGEKMPKADEGCVIPSRYE